MREQVLVLHSLYTSAVFKELHLANVEFFFLGRSPLSRVGLYGRLRRPRLHSVMPKRKLFGATLVLHAILGVTSYADACRSPPRTKPRSHKPRYKIAASLVPKGHYP
jgi:hypothetical protein